MTVKFSEARKQCFLRALRASGNQSLAAERAKVSRSWVQLHRTANPEFRRAVEEAVASFELGNGAGNKPPSGWGFLDGAELVVRGTGGAGGGKRVQIARARVKEWSPRVEDRFLATLAATCNVKAACAEVGLTAASAYGHRKRWRTFRRRWDAAEEEGYMRIEAGLLEAGANLLSGEELPEAAPLSGMTVPQAIHLLHMHKHQVRALGKAPGKRWKAPPSLNDPTIREGILRKLEMILDSEGLDPGQRARDRQEWARRRPKRG